MSRVVTCDTCGKEGETREVYLRIRYRDETGPHDAGFGALDMCDPCLASKPHKKVSGSPRRLPIHEAA